MKKSLSSRAFDIFNYILMGFIGFVTLYPFLYTISMSLSSTAEASRMGMHLYPREISTTAYKMVFNTPSFFRYYANTLIRTVVGTAGTLLVTSLFAYAISRKTMPHKKFFTNMLLFTMLFSGGTIPVYLNIKNLGLIDNFAVLILPGLITAYNTVIVKSFFEGIPESLIESAKIDGAKEYIVFFKIVMPISIPVLATVGLWVAVSHWNAWYDAMLYINSEQKQVVQTILRKIIMENSTDFVSKGVTNPDVMEYTPETIKAATIVVTILPILCVYPYIQKFFVKGAVLGAVKG